jgi:hypothetical protein
MSSLFKTKIILLVCHFIIIQCNNELKDRDSNKNIILLDKGYSLLNYKKNINIYSHFKELNQLKNLNGNENKPNNNEDGNDPHLHLKIICYGILFFSFISLLLIFFDYMENKKITRQYNFSLNQKVSDEYKKFKNTYITKGTFLFSLFIMKYIYPLANIINMYNYDYPRYLRFGINVIRFLFITILTIEVYIFIEGKIEETICYILTFATFLISHFISDLLIRDLLDFIIIRRNIIKPQLENLRKYVYYTIKKDVLFNSKWHALRIRMLTYFRICGNSILIKKKIDKYGKYVNNKQFNIKGNLPEKINKYINQDDDKDFNDNGLSERLLPPQNYSKNLERVSFNSLPNNKAINRNSMPKLNDNSNNNFCIVKGCEPFSFSRF